jgi:acyl dehydratase
MIRRADYQMVGCPRAKRDDRSPRVTVTGRRYFEDFEAGQVFELGTHVFTAQEMVDFASLYDPLPLHIDEEQARTGPFGTLIASGWQSAVTVGRMFSEQIVLDSHFLGSTGIEELRWLAPVRPGDVLGGRATVLEAKPSSHRTDRGSIRWCLELVNQIDQVVVRIVSWHLYRRTPGAAAETVPADGTNSARDPG